MAMTFKKVTDGQYLLNVEGYVCPHPQIYTKKALEKLHTGDVLEVVFDNPSSSESVGAMCEAGGNKIIAKNTEGGRYMWKIEKGA